jgi:hypothetical protein
MIEIRIALVAACCSALGLSTAFAQTNVNHINSQLSQGALENAKDDKPPPPPPPPPKRIGLGGKTETQNALAIANEQAEKKKGGKKNTETQQFMKFELKNVQITSKTTGGGKPKDPSALNAMNSNAALKQMPAGGMKNR